MTSSKRVMVDMSTTLIHNGHIRLFKFAKSISNKLVVGLYSDKLASESVSISQNLRLESLKETARELSFIDYLASQDH